MASVFCAAIIGLIGCYKKTVERLWDEIIRWPEKYKSRIAIIIMDCYPAEKAENMQLWDYGGNKLKIIFLNIYLR